MEGQRTADLRERRLRAHLSVAALARKARVDRKTIERAEDGLPIVDVSAQKIAEALGVERTDLFPEGAEAVA